MKQFSAPGSKTFSIPLKIPEGAKEAGGVKGQPGAKGGDEGAEGEGTTKLEEGDKRFEDEGGAEV